MLIEAFIFSQVQITEDVRQYLRKPTFDNWQWDEPETLVIMAGMHKMLVRIANREDPDQTASLEAV